MLILLLSPALRGQTAVHAKPVHAQAVVPAAAAPLPDIATMLRQVEAARQHNTTVMEDYLFDATTTVRAPNGKTDVKVAVISYVNGVRLERLISHNGQPLSASEAAKEQERSDKALAKAKARVAEAHEKGEETDSNGDKLITLDRLMQLYSVSNERREMIHGRSAIAFDFTANRSVKSKGVAEGMLQALAGTIWVDEKDHELAKMTGTMAGGYKVGFGLIMNSQQGRRGDDRVCAGERRGVAAVAAGGRRARTLPDAG